MYKRQGQEGGFVSDYLLYLLAAASDVASAQFHAQVRKAGLRVMGAYGHTRLTERVFGGVTRRMLTGVRIPLLLTH